ncbi:MAG: MoxR family ATPase, partial [Myxococcales bacterium]|nr:MoxR family ATPase [Myxococcales bacterium]
EPGTGKTQAAYFVAWHFGLDPAESVFKFVVRSTSEAQDLVYRFDDVAYFRDERGAAARREHVKRGPLWRAYDHGATSVVLIDEIDKAPRDFPNDLLDVLDQHAFEVPEYAAPGEDTYRVRKPADQPPPLVIITSNGERALPGPFLRRCVFHHIQLTEDLLRKAVERHRATDFPGLDDDAIEAGLAKVNELRRRDDLNKKPSTSEALRWLTVLDRRKVGADRLDVAPGRLPMLGVLVKDPDDLDLLTG